MANLIPYSTSEAPIRSTATIRLLTAGAVSAPLWAAVVVLQAVTRPGYDITRHPASMLSTGDLGWIQIANFLVAGMLTLGYAAGMRRLLRTGPASTWAPALLVVQGLGLLVAGVFPLRPGGGFPPGTPSSTSTTLAWHEIVHNIGGSLSFIAMIAVCFVLARRFAVTGDRRWARAGRVGAVLFTVCLLWASSGGQAGSATLFLGFVIAGTWISASGRRLASHQSQ